jgi:hypothetical protein
MWCLCIWYDTYRRLEFNQMRQNYPISRRSILILDALRTDFHLSGFTIFESLPESIQLELDVGGVDVTFFARTVCWMRQRRQEITKNEPVVTIISQKAEKNHMNFLRIM